MDLQGARCEPCEAGTQALPFAEAERLRSQVPSWRLDGDRLRRTWQERDFLSAIDRMARIASVAEQEGHHPDLHLTRYRHMEAVLWTHSVGGLSRNDFILAAKLDEVLP